MLKGQTQDKTRTLLSPDFFPLGKPENKTVNFGGWGSKIGSGLCAKEKNM